MRIGIDIDGVVCDSFTYWRDELNNHFGKDLEEISSYEMHLIYDVPYEVMDDFFASNIENLFITPQPMPGVKKAVEILRREHQVYLVTARKTIEGDVTRRWLAMHGIEYDKLMLVGDRNKAEVCKEELIDIFVEDYPLNAVQISKCGIPVIIFDAPYNRQELPGITRCYNWGQVVKAIKDLKLQVCS